MAQDDDSFGLPDINYKPLEPKPQTTASPPKVEKKPETSYSSGRIQTPGTPTRIISKHDDVDEGKSSGSVIISILVPILILVGGYFGYLYLYKKPKEKAAIEAAAKEKADKERRAKEEEARLAKLREEEEARLREANAKPAIGTIETLSAKTGRYYVIISSSVDDDLIMDLAQKLSLKGVSTKIIPPFGKWKFFRLTISDHDTFGIAQTSADESKAEYGNGVWVMKY